MELSGLGKILMSFGMVLIVIGGLFTLSGKIPWIGRLPGDIYIKKGNLAFYFPIVTSILLSIAFSLIVFFVGQKR